MKIFVADWILPLATVALAVWSIAWWLGPPYPEAALRLPNDATEAASGGAVIPDAAAEATIPLRAGTALRGDGAAGSGTGSWPCFRGLHRDNIATDSPPLARQWSPNGPPVLWTIEVGEGYAGAAIDRGRVFLLDYDEALQADVLRCLSLADGRLIWQNGYPVQLTRNHGLSRTVPAIAGSRVVTLGPRCQLACWDAETGECHWIVDLVQEFGTEVPRWYTGQCPLVVDNQVIVAPGGTALLAALDLQTGARIWSSPNPRAWKMTHSSIVPMDCDGQATLVYCGSGGVAGVDAATGRLLWDSTEWPEQFATSPSPVVLPGQRLFLCSGYGSQTGSLLLEVETADSGPWQTRVLRRLSPKEFNAEQHTPILVGDHLYGIRKRGGGQLVCMDLEGRERWNSGSDRFGHGPFLVADQRLLVLGDDGCLSMVQLSVESYQLLGRHQIFDHPHDPWGPLALADGHLVLRDLTRMTCLDLRPGDVSPSP